MFVSSNVILVFPSGANVSFHNPETNEVERSITLDPNGRLQYDSITDVVNAKQGNRGSFVATNNGHVYHVSHDRGYLIKGDQCD